MFEQLKTWWKNNRPKSLYEDIVTVEWDQDGFRLRALDPTKSEWNHDVRWDDIERVCFTAEGIAASDIIIVRLRSQTQSVIVPTEARHGTEFFEKLIENGLFPEPLWRKALGSTNSATICWPPYEV